MKSEIATVLSFHQNNISFVISILGLVKNSKPKILKDMFHCQGIIIKGDYSGKVMSSKMFPNRCVIAPRGEYAASNFMY